MRSAGWDVEVASSAANAVDGSGLILTTTPARQPILKKEDIAAGNQLSALESIDEGVTTTVDWSHALRTPACCAMSACAS